MLLTKNARNAPSLDVACKSSGFPTTNKFVNTLHLYVFKQIYLLIVSVTEQGPGKDIDGPSASSFSI